MKPKRQRFRFASQFRCEFDRDPLSALTVKQRAGGQLDVKRLFQTNRLSAQLNGVTVIRLGLPALVFDRIGNPQPAPLGKLDALICGQRTIAAIFRRRRIDFMEFDHVGNASNPQSGGFQTQPAHDADVRPRLRASCMNAIVHDLAQRRQDVFRPRLLHVNQRALPRTKSKMLQSGNHQKFVFGVEHGNDKYRNEGEA